MLFHFSLFGLRSEKIHLCLEKGIDRDKVPICWQMGVYYSEEIDEYTIENETED